MAKGCADQAAQDLRESLRAASGGKRAGEGR
jgi:hypothetical protein